jgi:hypothetical protein
MSLSDSERQSFEQLEAQLRESDPDFVRKLSSAHIGQLSTKKIILGVGVFIAGIVAMLFGITLNFLILGVAGFVLMGTGAYIGLTREGHSNVARGTGSGNTGTKTTSPFMKRLEDSWEERRRQEGR